MNAVPPLFGFVQFEWPWPLGPPDGRYLARPAQSPDAPATHVIVVATLGAPERRRFSQRRKQRDAAPEPDPTPVATGRATIVNVGQPLCGLREARAWLEQAGAAELDRGLEVLNRALHAFRLVTADPYVNVVTRRQAIAARVGFGAGEQVADGLWMDARELIWTQRRQRRARALPPQARLAAVLGARERLLVCEELALRARLDLELGHDRQAALQVLVALDAALAELSSDAGAETLSGRLDELRSQREPVAAAAQSALGGGLSEPERRSVSLALQRIEAALRARAVRGA